MIHCTHIADPIAFCCLAREERRLSALQYARLRRMVNQNPDCDLAEFVLRQGWLDADQLNRLAERSNPPADKSGRSNPEASGPFPENDLDFDDNSTLGGNAQSSPPPNEQPLIIVDPEADAEADAGADQLEVADKDYTDNYVIRGELGRGGLGRVLLAYDRSLGREVAIKEMLLAPTAEKYPFTLARFLNEAKVTGCLQHPGIIPVHAMGARPDGTFYYVMKYISGRSLKEELRAARDGAAATSAEAPLEFIDKLITVCDAVGFAHSKGYIHRDLKTDNVILGEFNETLVLDWGLAKSAEEVSEQKIKDLSALGEIGISDDLTLDDEILGTPAYMAPEQMDPSFGEIDPRSDVYALGVILFEILTGETPYARAGTLRNLALSLTGIEQTPSPAERAENLPPELVAICNKAIAKNKSQRYQSVSELARDLKAFRRGEMIPGLRYSRRQRLARQLREHSLIIAACALILCSLLIGATFANLFAAGAS